jgi:hypothetical protein
MVSSKTEDQIERTQEAISENGDTKAAQALRAACFRSMRRVAWRRA